MDEVSKPQSYECVAVAVFFRIASSAHGLAGIAHRHRTRIILALGRSQSSHRHS